MSAKKREFKVAFRLNNKRENSRVEIDVADISTLKKLLYLKIRQLDEVFV